MIGVSDADGNKCFHQPITLFELTVCVCACVCVFRLVILQRGHPHIKVLLDKAAEHKQPPQSQHILPSAGGAATGGGVGGALWCHQQTG